MLWASLLLLFSTNAHSAGACDVRAAVAPLFEDHTYSSYLNKISKNKNGDIQKLYEMVNYRGNRYLKEAETSQIAKIFSDTSLSEADQAEKAFQVYFEARLGHLSESEQELLRKKLRNIHVELTDAYINGAVHRVSGEVTLRIPEKYSESLVKYTLLSHELEHSIQIAKLDRNVMPHFSLKPKLNRRFEYESFLAELGAMKSEAEWVNAIPESVKAKMFDQLKTEENKTLQKIGNYFFSEPQSSVETYVARQWDLGRNTRKKFFWKNARLKVLENLPFYVVSNGVKFAGLYGGHKAVKAYCDHQRKKPALERNGRLDRLFCRRP
jgi:hypothetical protein